MATSTLGLLRRCWSSQQCYLNCLRTTQSLHDKYSITCRLVCQVEWRQVAFNKQRWHPHPLTRVHARACGTHTHTHTHTQPFNGLWSGTTRVGRYQKKHAPTHTPPEHWTSIINFLHSVRSIASSLFSLRASQSSLTTSLSRSSLVFLLVLDPLLHTPCISSPNHHLIFAAHAHTIAACSAVIPMLFHLYLVSLSAPYLEMCLLA